MSRPELPEGLRDLPLANLFSGALNLENMAITSGVLPLLDDQKPRSDDFRTQLGEALNTMVHRLEDCGKTIDQVVFVLVFVTVDLGFSVNYNMVNGIWEDVFGGMIPMPCRAVIQVKGLPFGAKAEVIGVAVA